MTVAIVVKVFDGLVLAADSATTIGLANGGAQVYNHANKICHLHRTKPVGLITWGLGQIGAASIATIAKDLRERLMGHDFAHNDWELAPDYTVEAVAERVVELFFDELYEPVYAKEKQQPVLGMIVAGYSGGESQPESWLIEIIDTKNRPTPQLEVARNQAGWVAKAQPQASSRLFNGADPELLGKVLGAVPAAHHPAVIKAFQGMVLQPAIAPMPLTDAINLARFLVDTTVGYSRFLLGPDTVGGPVEVAAISRHEGFKWISRKHYYTMELNPTGVPT